MSPDVVEQLRARVGEIVSVSRCGGSQGAVWRVATRGMGELAVKVASAREVASLRRVQGLVPDVPEIVTELDGAIALRWIEGEVVVRDDAEVHERAGALLRRVHDVRVRDDDPVAIADAVAARVERWTTRARGKVPDDAIARVVATVEPGSFADASRVQCHRDFTPNNWIARADGSVAAIDFGQARLDLPQWDLVKLAADAWRRDPRLRACFAEGYGAVDPRVDRLVALHGLQTLVWGLDHADAHFIALGRRVLDLPQ